MSDEISNSGFKEVVKGTAQKLASEYSPDLSKLVALKVNPSTIIYLTQEKLDKYGEEHFIKKYSSIKIRPISLDEKEEE